MSRERTQAILEQLGVAGLGDGAGEPLQSIDPASGETQGTVRALTRAQYDARVAAALGRFEEWRMRPAPKRGEVVRGLGELLSRRPRQIPPFVRVRRRRRPDHARHRGYGEPFPYPCDPDL